MQKATANPIVRLHRLGNERRVLLLRAAVLLSFASASVALLPFRRAIRFGSVPLGKPESWTVVDCVWAIEAAARRLPWRTMCIEKGLAAQRLLRNAGIGAILHYGVRHEPAAGTLEAHVWLSVAGENVVGGDQAGRFAEVATYP